MAIDLNKYGITGSTEIVYNPSYELLAQQQTQHKQKRKKLFHGFFSFTNRVI